MRSLSLRCPRIIDRPGSAQTGHKPGLFSAVLPKWQLKDGFRTVFQNARCRSVLPADTARRIRRRSFAGRKVSLLARFAAFEPKSLSARQMSAKPANFPQRLHSPFGLSVVEGGLTMV